jgi:hypothetical protein
MWKWLSLMVVFVFFVSCTAEPMTSSMASKSPISPIEPSSPKSDTTQTAAPTLDPDIALVPQLIADLASRTGVSSAEIRLLGLRPVRWQKDVLECPPVLEETASRDFIMIVTEGGARYELVNEKFVPGKEDALQIRLSANESNYAYYVVDDVFIFCPLSEEG